MKGHKQVDLLCRNASGGLFGVEIAISSPQQEVQNACQDLLGATPVDELLVCCTTNKMLKKVKAALDACQDLESVRDKITMCLAGRFFE